VGIIWPIASESSELEHLGAEKIVYSLSYV